MDRPYVTENPDNLRRKWDSCPVAGLSTTRSPAWSLERWKAVRDLITGWYGDDRPDVEAVPELVEARVGWLDPVQRLVVERLFAGWRAIFPKDSQIGVDLNPDPSSVFDHERRVELRVQPTVSFTRADGSVERVRLRTGTRTSGADDAAVLVTSHPEAVTLDALVGAGVAEDVTASSDTASRLEELFELAVRDVDRRTDLNPGVHCFSCPSAPRCGQYPVVGQGRVFVSTRSISVSKTALGWLGTCERRVAWDRLHQIPVHVDEETQTRRGLATGIVFHETAASAIFSDDPSSVVEAACARVAPAEASELRRLWDNHETLWETDGQSQARTVEYPAGFTLMVPGIHVDSRGNESLQPVAVTFIGILDVTGRELDGTPMVVEHRTGASGEHGPLELDLYAVSAAEAVRRATGHPPETLAVHLHHLGPSDPVCRRTAFDAETLRLALDRLRAAADRIAGWHPDRSLAPDYSVGPWCASCRHRPTCEEFRRGRQVS
ncbi:MAG: PD-(D/E)XK nuclease family protein [Acidimicrobiia bacterium]|nr:PD-(D/E)XK nuclease family protein [Acidimicrobiia bacterium]